MMENHFAENELVDKKAWFMALTYNRLGELFSAQFMQEPAIYCIKQSLIFDRIAHSSPSNIANILYHLGKQYDKLNEADSAAYYYEKALETMPDRNSMLYRDVVTSKALFECKVYGNIAIALDSMKSMAAQATSDTERLNRFLTIGGVYKSMGQYDSAKVYLEPVFEKDSNNASIVAKYLRDIALAESDTLKANQYSLVLTKDAAAAPENLFRASQLNDLFQNYLHGKQEKAEAERRLAEQEAARLRWRRGVVTAVVVLLVLGLGLWWWLAKRKKEHEAETQTWHEEKQQLQTQVDDALQQLQTQADDALQQARAMLPQRANEIYSSKVGNRLERIMYEFETAYPEALGRVAAAYPDLTPTERRIFVLSHLQFRAKEMADLLGLSENTVNQYRYNLRKKTENASFSAFLD
jgi:DNA-binding CsgD family transcriptional regulator